ncbi:guanine deaminase [Cetobacterium sp. SF1]|uniref:guanine deaminase n=1 Tax=Cetobacterium sp. SF1 TaxID=3417654 RepID=UPI003CEED44B
MGLKAYKGTIVHTPKLGAYEILEDGYIVVENDKVVGTYETLPGEYKNVAVKDYTGKMIIPGFVDLHFHAPQFSNRGLGLDKELLPWLETYTFPEEAKYKNLDYARAAYGKVVHELWRQGTTRAVLFGTIHRKATKALMEMLDDAGLGAMVGKVNMDRNSPPTYCEETKDSIEETKKFIEQTKDKYKLVKPIITPRFVPTCTPELMKALGKMAVEYGVPVQSHLDENRGEIGWVESLHPESDNYSTVYEEHGLFGKDVPTVMAHCIWNKPEEIKLMSERKMWVAHCPHSNTNLSSGIAPIRTYLENGVKVGLASDISGGHDVSIPRTIAAAAQSAKLRWVYLNDKEEILSTPEWLYLATKGGGEFFGKVGSFEPGYDFDALIIDDSSIADVNPRTVQERIERYIYVGDDRNIEARYVAGKFVPEPKF